ncbi:MAG: FHA domain-containing protein [Planctomycetota bacterium]|nr:MAG: FHA domain-containing protein [Planctomycetota bacterium]
MPPRAAPPPTPRRTREAATASPIPAAEIPDPILHPNPRAARRRSREKTTERYPDAAPRLESSAPPPSGARPFRSGAELVVCVEPIDPADGEAFEPVPLGVGDRLVLGRSAEGNDIILPSPKVSRQHAVIERTPAGVTVRDLISRNGVFVGDERIEPDTEVPLTLGRSALIGAYRVVVVSPRNAARRTTSRQRALKD